MVLDAIEGDLVTKSDLAIFQERMDNRFGQVENQFVLVQNQIKEFEFRLSTRLGFLIVSTASIAVAILMWLIKL